MVPHKNTATENVKVGKDEPPDAQGCARGKCPDQNPVESESAPFPGCKQVEQRLHVTLSLQDAILDHVDRFIVVCDPNGLITVFNRAAERLLGYDAEEMVGKATPAVFHDPEEVAQRARQLTEELGRTIHPGLEVFVCRLEPGVYDEREWTYVRKDGSRFPMLTSLTSLRDDAGRLMGYVGIAQDITQRRKADEELRKAKQAAEASNHAKSEFLANMSHEIRTPMNGILGMAEILRDSGLTEEQHEYADTIRDCAESLLTVINDILDFSKIEAGRLSLEQIRFDLPDMLGKTMHAMSIRAWQKNLKATCTIATTVPRHVVGDPDRLRQVIVNLVGNAIKFTEQGRVTLFVSQDEAPAASGHSRRLHFEVVDTGIGIPADKQRAIFEAFTQADSSTTRQFGGTGLGLSISSRLVQMMGGRIWVESELGKGSSFHFTAEFGFPPEPADEGAPAELAHSTGSAARRMKILLAEDNRINKRVFVHMLEKMGHHVTVVSTGREALAALAKDHFDLVLMDVQMPDMDGFEATAAIRAQERTTGEHIAIVALTAHAMRGDRERCLAAGMDDYLTKPIDRLKLRRVLAARTPPATTPCEDASGAGTQLATFQLEATPTDASVLSPIPHSDQVFDEAEALAKADGDFEFLRMLATMFIEDAPQMLCDIRMGVAKRDADHLRKSAHRLKGAAIPFCAPAVLDAAQSLETMGQTNALSAAETRLCRLEQGMAQLLQRLTEICACTESHEP